MESITLHEYQVKAWNSKKRFIFMSAGVQSGKTTFGAVWILNEAQRCGQGEYIIVAPSYKLLQQSTLTKFLEIAPKGYGAYFKAESVYRTVDNRTFFLRSADKPESIEGITAKAIWADEASIMKPNIWLIMQGRVSKTGGRILLTFTPLSLNWIHREIEKDKERRLRGEPGDIDFIQFRSVDSPYFPKEEFERARRMLTPTQFQLRYEGKFGKAEGLVYTGFQNYHIVEPFAIPKEWRKAGGIDFGYNNPFAALKGAVSPDDVLYIYDERYKDRASLEAHVDFLGSEITYFADPSGAQEIAELRKLGVKVTEANNDVRLGIQKVNERLRASTGDKKSVRLKVFSNCIHLIDEFALYRYPDVGGDKPVKEDDHAQDSLRYLVMGLERPERKIYWV
jgi:PBSX family phage terminase large subunit